MDSINPAGVVDVGGMWGCQADHLLTLYTLIRYQTQSLGVKRSGTQAGDHHHTTHEP